MNNLKLKLFYNYSNLIIFDSLNIAKQIKLKLKYIQEKTFCYGESEKYNIFNNIFIKQKDINERQWLL